jgi:hypothetical protein
VDVENGLAVEAANAGAVAACEQVRVEALEVVGAKVAKWYPPDRRDDVQRNVVAVAGPRARPERDAVGGQPALGEVHAERQAAAPVGAAARVVDGEPLRQLVSVGAVGSGRMPASSRAAGDRVESP